jgi:serine/threonine-protein kinase
MVMEKKSESVEDLKVCLECNRQFTGIVAACPHDGTPLVKVMQDPLVGTTLAAKYEIQSVVGHGGMGVVYKARDTNMDRLVAVKMLKAQLISDSMSVKRFHHEGKAASRINHPHVITVHEFGISPSGQPFIVMDFLEGTSLAQVIKDDGQVSVERTVKILMQACDALNHAHRHGVVHRDLKPSNIVLIDYDGQKDFVKVVDFGVAKLITGAGQDLQRLTQAGEVCGSPVYMSPEQCQGEELDPRSDIYSMGVVIYESLTGQLPFFGQTMVETMSKHITEMAPPFTEARPDLYIPERLEAVVFKALSKNREERHGSMALLKQDLEMAIPKPGRSQVLRSADGDGNAKASGTFEAQKSKGKYPIFNLAAAAFLFVICCSFLFIKNSAFYTPVSPAKSGIGTIQTPSQVQPQKPLTAVQTGLTRPAAAQPPATTPGSVVNQHLEHETAKGIVTAPALTAPNVERSTNPAKVPTQKTTASENPKNRVSMIAPLRRKAYSTASEESALRQRMLHKGTERGGRSRQHAASQSSTSKPSVDRWEDLIQSHSYKQDWRDSK